MDPLLKKMNYKDESDILIIHTPEELKDRFKEFEATVKCHYKYEALPAISFAIIFVHNEQEVSEAVEAISSRLTDDSKVWLSYPKKSSKRYKSQINRDHGWKSLGEIGFEPVRQVAVNEDFSALRFRRVKNIKSITRSKEMALTKEAKERTTDVTARRKNTAPPK